jgi:hypothetical protein
VKNVGGANAVFVEDPNVLADCITGDLTSSDFIH